ncbi:MAG: flagellar biosynthesis anti-sigma factor FlgM [Pseudomonadota bacterium]
MKINSGIPSIGTAPDSGRARGTAAPQPKPGASAGERVDISSLSARLQEVGGGEAPVNAQRVAEIKQAITEGRFQINPERIADGLLASVRDMLGRANKAA